MKTYPSVICIRSHFSAPDKLEDHLSKRKGQEKKERALYPRRKKGGEEKKSNRSTLSIHNGYFGDSLGPIKTIKIKNKIKQIKIKLTEEVYLAVTFSKNPAEMKSFEMKTEKNSLTPT